MSVSRRIVVISDSLVDGAIVVTLSFFFLSQSDRSPRNSAGCDGGQTV